MEKGNTNHVNIYYSEEEVHDAFKNYYNDVKQVSKVHIFTKNAIPLSLYGKENNVELYFSGGLWDKLKAWLAREALFEQQLSQLNISKESQERYRSIIKNGGTIIVSTQIESINLPIKDSNDLNVEGAPVTPIPSPITNDVNLPQTNANDLRIDSQIEDTAISKTFNENVHNHEVENVLFNAQSDDESPLDTEIISSTPVAEDLNAFDVNDISELDAQLDKGTSTDLDLQNKFNVEEKTITMDNTDEHKTSEEFHSNESSSLNDSTQPNSHEQNLYIADVSTSPFANHQQYEYHEDGPKKHNLYSENQKKLSSEQEDHSKSDTNEETFVFPTNHESVSLIPDETSNHTVDIMNLLNTNGTNQEEIEISIQQLQDLAQQAQQFYGFDNKQSEINELLDLVLQLSPDEAMSIFNKITNSNIPTDSTESVLDFDLLAKLGGHELDEVKNLFAVERALENEMNLESDDQIKLPEDNTAEAFEAEQLPNEISTEPTSEHNRRDSQ